MLKIVYRLGLLLLHRFPVLLCNPAGSRVIFMAVLTNQTHSTGADTPKETPEVSGFKATERRTQFAGGCGSSTAKTAYRDFSVRRQGS